MRKSVFGPDTCSNNQLCVESLGANAGVCGACAKRKVPEALLQREGGSFPHSQIAHSTVESSFSTQNMEPSAMQCYLLELPREIRQYIYDEVIHHAQPIDLPWCVAWRFTGDHQRKKAPEGGLSLPWLNLKSTCKAIHAELEAYMNLKGPSPEAECRTWSLELFGAPITIPVRIALRDPVRWRRIACPPASMETLAVTITFLNQRTKFSNRSGPTEITRHLYQALNQILHYGPLLTRRSPLPEPLKIKTLVVQVAIDQSLQPVIPALDSRWFLRIPASEFHALCDLVDVLESTGLLWGYVERIRIMDEDGIYEEFEISRVENAGVPKRWDSYGFDWGPIEGEPMEAAKAA